VEVAWVYELFITTLDIDRFLVEDVLDLYHGRGAFEAVLADEDVEVSTPAVVERNPIVLGSMRLSSMWPVERFAVAGPPTGVGNMWRCFPWLKPSQRPSLLLVHPVRCVRIIAGVGMIGSRAMPGGDHPNCGLPSLVFPLFSLATRPRRNRTTKKLFSMPCHLPLSGSGGQGSSVSLQQPASLPPVLADDAGEVPPHAEAMDERSTL
jgi:hypothetical protein